VFKLTAEGTETILYAFAGPPVEGDSPSAPLLMDASGNLFGATEAGGGKKCNGSGGCGTLFEIMADGTESTIFDFPKSGGEQSSGALIEDQAGNLYGTTINGGSKRVGGVLFALTP
jgi:hypothetical protein